MDKKWALYCNLGLMMNLICGLVFVLFVESPLNYILASMCFLLALSNLIDKQKGFKCKTNRPKWANKHDSIDHKWGINK